MKAAKSRIPIDALPDTAWYGGPIDWFDISLSVKGEKLVPEEITAIMRREPNRAQQKNKSFYRDDGSFMRVPSFGAWWAVLKPEDTDEWDCGEAMLELLSTLPNEPALWHALAAQYRVSFFVGLSMAAPNKGFELSPEIMSYLGDRRITAGFDVYYDPEKTG